MTIELGYYNDGKDKWMSHEIMLADEDCYIECIDAMHYNPFEIVGYGNTKEEALEDFKKKFEYLMEELNAFSKMLFETNIITDNIIELNRFGKKIDN